MMAFATTNPATLRRWAISAVVVVLVHGAIVTAVVTWRKATVPAEPPGPVVIELAPMPAAPTTEQAALPPAPEQVPDPLVLPGGQAQLPVRLSAVRGGSGHRRRVRAGPGARARRGVHRATSARITEVKKPSPSLPGPVSGSIACSGCGMIPTTFPPGPATAAIPRAEPFGLPPQ